MFLPVNIREKNCRQYFNFYCKWYIWRQPSRVVPFKRSFVQVCLGTPVGESFPVKLWAVCLLFWWRWASSRGFFKYFVYYYYILIYAILSESISTTLNRIFPYAKLSGASRTTLHKVLNCPMLSQEHQDDFEQDFFLCNVDWCISGNIAQGFDLCNNVVRELTQH